MLFFFCGGGECCYTDFVSILKNKGSWKEIRGAATGSSLGAKLFITAKSLYNLVLEIDKASFATNHQPFSAN